MPAVARENVPGIKRLFRRRLFRWGAVAVGGIVLLLALAGTGPVLRLGLPWLNQTISSAVEGHFELTGLRGSIWTGIAVDGVVLDIPQTGFRLTTDEAEFEWTPTALFAWRLEIDRVAAKTVTMTVPDGPDSGEDVSEEDSGIQLPPFKIRLGELSLPEIVVLQETANRRFRYGLSAQGRADDRPSGQLHVSLEPLDDSVDRLQAALDYDAVENRLTAEVAGQLDHAGLVMTLAGLSPEEAPDLEVSLKGSGTLDDWQGKFAFQAKDRAGLAGDVGIGLAQDKVGFTFDGVLKIDRGLAPELPNAVLGDADFNMAGALSLGGGRLDLSRLELAKQGLARVDATLNADLDSLEGDLELRADVDPAASGLLDDRLRWQGLGLQAHLGGDFTKPTIRMDLAGFGVETPVSSIQGLTLISEVVPSPDGWDFTADLASVDTHWTDPALRDLLGTSFAATLRGQVDEGFQDFHLDQVEIPTLDLAASGNAKLGEAGDVTDAAATVRIADLSRLQAVVPLPISGVAVLDLSEGVWSEQQGGEVRFSVAGAELSSGISELDHLVGQNPELSGTLTVSPDQDLSLSLTGLDMAHASATGTGRIHDDFGQLSAKLSMSVAPGAVPSGLKITLGGPVTVEAEADGPLELPTGKVKVAAGVVEVAGEEFRDLTLDTALSWVSGVPELDSRAGFNLRNRSYRAAARMSLAADLLTVADASLVADGLDVGAMLSLPGYAPPVIGRISLDRVSPAILADWGAPDLRGQLYGQLDLAAAGEKQVIDLELQADDLTQPNPEGGAVFSLTSVSLAGQVSDALGRPDLDLMLKVREADAAGLAFESVQARVSGPQSAMDAELTATGSYGGALALALNSHAQVAVERGLAVTADRLDLSVGEQEVALAEPLIISQSPDGLLQASAKLRNNEGDLALTLAFQPEQSIDARVDVRSIRLDGWAKTFGATGVSGVLTGNASLNEAVGTAPQVVMEATLADIGLTNLPTLPPLSMAMRGDFLNGTARAAMDLTREGQSVAHAQATLPLAVSALAGTVDVSDDLPLAASARIDGEIADFWPYVPLPDHDLSGRVRMDAKVGGTSGNPIWEGQVSLDNGNYENLQFGTLFRNIDLKGAFGPDGLSIDRLSADDGGNGEINGSALLRLREGEGLTYNANLTMTNTAVARLDELRAWTDVTVDVNGTDREMYVTSRNTIRRGEFDLAAALPVSVPELDVENLDPSGDQSDREKAAKKKEILPVHLDVTVDIPGRFFVRGRGLDSEWGGQLTITGLASDPKITGKLTALRGQLDVIGKVFTIQDSSIVFSGAQPPDPLLNISGVYNTDDLKVIASFAGPASDPELTLTSEPFLPQDEILSRILFGRSQGSLSAFEAVQLASAAAELSGQGGGLDIVGTLRRFIGVDVLRVEGGENGPSVKAGEYLTEGVYVGTKQGTTPGSTGVEVEIDITPSLKATSEATEADTKAGLQFKFDY